MEKCLMETLICPMCKKEFRKDTMWWGYVIGDAVYCSMQCMTAASPGAGWIYLPVHIGQKVWFIGKKNILPPTCFTIKKISIVIKAPGYDYIGGQSIFVEGITDDGKRISGNMGILVHLTREQAEQKQKEIEQ